MLDPSPSVIYTKAQSNTGSLTHWARPGMEPASSWMLVRFASAEPRWELLGERQNLLMHLCICLGDSVDLKDCLLQCQASSVWEQNVRKSWFHRNVYRAYGKRVKIQRWKLWNVCILVKTKVSWVLDTRWNLTSLSRENSGRRSETVLTTGSPPHDDNELRQEKTTHTCQ